MDSLLASRQVQLSFTLCAIYISWRIWRFTIRPRLHPNSPKELPYHLPFIGHALSFFSDFNGTVAKGQKYFAATNEPFTITVAGQTIYIATSPEDVNTVWNKSKVISMQPIAEEMYTRVGISREGRVKMFEVHQNADYNKGLGRPVNPTDMTKELHHQTLRNGPGLEELMQKTISRMSSTLQFDNSANPLTVSLFDMCVEIFIANGTDIFFGHKLRQLEPDLINAFKGWEDSNWKLLFQIPGFFAKDMLSAKHTLVGAFTRYYELPRSERPGATVFITALEDMLREAGLEEEDMGKFTLLHYWAIFGNVYKLAFWVVARIVHDASLLHAIREEVTPAVKNDIVDESYLLEKFPKLEALINETLRLTVQSSLGRGVIEETVIGGKMLRAGNKIMLPISSLHLSPTFPSPTSFLPSRFTSSPKLSKSPSYRPWGGGTTVCPGRFFARRMVNAFVATLVVRYDVTLADEEGGKEKVKGGFPQADGSRPAPGVVLIGRGEDVTMRLTARLGVDK